MPDANRKYKIAIIVLFILFVGSSIISLNQIEQKDASIAIMSGDLSSQKQEISQLKSNISNIMANLSGTEEILKNETQTRKRLEEEIINLTMVTKSDYGVLGVDQNEVGHVIPLEVIIKEGKSNLFLNVANVLVDETMQSSAQIAIRVAREYARVSLADKDVLINIKSPLQEGQLTISGGSAGGAITIAAIAAMEDKAPKEDVLMTGTINEDHSIGRIGAQEQKV